MVQSVLSAPREPEGVAGTVLVSIITPSLNGIEYLPECIESTRRQATRNVEVEHIFVDGGSTDGTAEFAAAQGCTVLTREELSVYFALNKGARHANGTLLGSLGCDDIFLPGALDSVVQHYQRTGARWLVGGCRWMDRREVPRGDLRAPPTWLSASMHACLGWNCIPDLSTFLHRDFYFELGGYDNSFMYSGDYDLYARALQREPFARIDRIITGVRRHGDNLSLSVDPRRLAEERAVTERYGPRSEWQRTAYRYLLKLWLNGTNPKWFLYKRIDALHSRRPNARSSTA
jgi:glycosyltransferase involved in cell wall biosynthesis